MTKKTSDETAAEGPEKGRLTVVSATGIRQRFLRGMITHDLVQRGLDFDAAYATAQAVRDRLSDREEVTTDEIRDLIREEVEHTHGAEVAAGLSSAPLRPTPERHVIYHGQEQPFSRGLLARSIQSAGIDLGRAYRLVAELEGELRQEGIKVLPSGEVARRVGDLLERIAGSESAGRYRLMRRIRRLPRPVVIYIGGATGTGKSTLSLELAPMLRIYRINSTDTIRQVMRMVFSPEIMPALYSSSFEVAPPYGPRPSEEYAVSPRDPDFGEHLVASFEEQAARVIVGVRAVVERAIAENMSILVEGVHLYPPLVPFADLEGAAYQVPLILMTRDTETHRIRFLARARLSGRWAERYLEHFPSIRTIHEFLVQQAEAHDISLLDTSYGEPPIGESLRLVSSLLQKRLPALGQPSMGQFPAVTPTLLLIIDGLPDRPVRALGGRTPLQAARTPNLDRLAREGQCGLTDPVAPGAVADTAAGTLALFGQSPFALKRGPVEALGAGIELAPGDIALRGNLATLDVAGRVIDRRAGRIREQSAVLAQALDRLPLPASLAQEVEIRVQPATEHRLAIVLRGEGLSSRIRGSDPGDGAAPDMPLIPRPLDPSDERAVHTARVLGLFEQEARRVLATHPVNAARAEAGQPPANAVLTRGAGSIHRLVPLEEAGLPLRLACIGGDRTVLGLASWLGAEIVTGEKMTANLDTDLDAKFGAALEALKRNDLVIVHVKGADIAAHDQRPDLKVSFLEKVDRTLGDLLDHHPEPLRVAVASDHATLSESGQHAADPLPVLIWGHGIEADEVRAFDEQSVAAGRLQRFPLQMFLGRIFDLS